MARRIALTIFPVLLLTGFTLPQDERAVYVVSKPASAKLLRVQGNSARFSITVGVHRHYLRGASHRENAQIILDVLAKELQGYSRAGVRISLGKVYAVTGEAVLHIDLDDAGQTENTRTELLQRLSLAPEVFFASESRRLTVK